jgi:RNA polymerase sigma-70 factor (ECF subfamily)
MVERLRSQPRANEIDEDDEVLVEIAKTDRRAFTPLYRRYADPVYRVCYRRLQTPEAAQDLAATIFERALIALPRFTTRGPGSFRSWLFTIAHHNHRQHRAGSTRDSTD